MRHAIEPWHVLGEESAPGGAVRYVDSSVERMQVLVKGMTGERHLLTCNGTRIPLHPTGIHGEFVAGVRYRAWQPPSCLHPTIPVHTPLVFDLVDSGTSARSAVAPTTRPTPAAAATIPSRSIPTKPRPAASRASSASATP
jgi:uncharacterized protein (DUF2126 family)